LREDLLMMQMELRAAAFPVIVVFAGVDGAGKSETVNQLHEWLDSRWLVTRASANRPTRSATGPNIGGSGGSCRSGRMGFVSQFLVFDMPILDRVYGSRRLAEFDERLERIKTFEKTLADDGALILKFWMHLSKDAQKERLRKLEKNPLLHWRISKRDWQHWECTISLSLLPSARS
jgi:polyphosphate kinase 2 (PPK2 family)